VEEHKNRIKTFILPFFKTYPLTDGEDMFALGVVNSLFAMQLVMFVEKEFQINVENKDLDFENFQSINAIAQLVDRKLNGT
jgi:acyl carrier protein